MPRKIHFTVGAGGVKLHDPKRERAAAKALLKTVPADTRPLFEALVRQLRDPLSKLAPFDQLELVTKVATICFKVSTASTKYVNQPDAPDRDDVPPAKTLTEIITQLVREAQPKIKYISK